MYDSIYKANNNYYLTADSFRIFDKVTRENITEYMEKLRKKLQEAKDVYNELF